MKSKLVYLASGLATLALTSCVYAATNNSNKQDNFIDKGLYVIAQAGAAQTTLGALDDMFTFYHFDKNTGFAGRVGLGYQLARYIAIESGVSYYSAVNRHYLNPYYIPKSGDSATSTTSLDLMLLGRIPMGHYFFIGAGAGVAFLHTHYGALIVTDTRSNTQIWGAGSANFIAPKVEGRVGVKINPKVSLFVSASDILSVNGHNTTIRDYQPNLAMYALGAEYAF